MKRAIAQQQSPCSACRKVQVHSQASVAKGSYMAGDVKDHYSKLLGTNGSLGRQDLDGPGQSSGPIHWKAGSQVLSNSLARLVLESVVRFKTLSDARLSVNSNCDQELKWGDKGGNLFMSKQVSLLSSILFFVLASQMLLGSPTRGSWMQQPFPVVSCLSADFQRLTVPGHGGSVLVITNKHSPC